MSNAFRDFSVVRRRANLIDLITPKRVGVKGYRLQASSNFDGVFTTLMTADIGSGYLDPNVNSAKLNAINNPNHIRIVFDPATFAATATIADDQHIWLRFVPVDFSGVAGTPGPVGLVLPDDEHKASGRILIAGTAPNGVDVSASLRLDLPARMRDVHIRNNAASGGTVLYVATAVGGAERAVAGGEVLSMQAGAQGCLLVRGGGGTVSFSADFTHFLPL